MNPFLEVVGVVATELYRLHFLHQVRSDNGHDAETTSRFTAGLGPEGSFQNVEVGLLRLGSPFGPDWWALASVLDVENAEELVEHGNSW